MTWKQALKKSIEKWDKICFERGIYDRNCALCDMPEPKDGGCGNCPLALTGQECLTEKDLYSRTSDCRTLYPRGCNGDIQLYLYFCMLYHEYYGDEG